MDKEKDTQKDMQLGQETASPVSFLRFVSLKSEKFSQALYLITSYIPETEPLKAKIREASIDLISDSPMLAPAPAWSVSWGGENEVSPLFKVSVLESVLNNLHKISLLLRLAMAGSLISEMNYQILQRELASFEKQLTDHLSQNGFAQNLLVASHEDGLTKKIDHIGQENQKALMRPTPQSSAKKSYGQPNPNFKKNEEVKKASRRGEILNFLKDKDWTSIKDISESISGCSVKTIQRELLDLVHKGILKKKGDRRWSRYLLA
ncbi:MAG: hypothetical protein NTV48_00595 [Candidatus Vogelbacteria bacterium]|nr:hypothetical protein [Candidatus Vogelbacteria bacterium]